MQRPVGNALLLVILLFTLFSRFWNLTWQSLWYDELYLMCVADPAHSLTVLFNDLKAEFHPPFIFLFDHYIFGIFGFSDLAGRMVSAFFGTAGVLAMYFLGKQMNEKRTGILTALVTSISYYHLYHSQEIRMYAPLFLFSALSALYFLKALKTGKNGHFIFYVLWTSLMFYTHYFGVFVFLAEALAFIHIARRKPGVPNPRKWIFSVAAILLLYLPWVPYILATGTRGHWMHLPGPWYLIIYFYHYVGKEPISFLIYLFGLFLFLYFLYADRKSKFSDSSPGRYLTAYGLLAIYILSYLVSIFKPVLQVQCTVAGMPFLFTAIILGLEKLKEKYLWLTIAILAGCFFINIFFVRKYYTRIDKEDFRTVAASVSKEPATRLVMSSYADFYNYYLRQMNSRVTVIDPVGRDPQELLSGMDTLWILNAHNPENVMTLEKYRKLADYLKAAYQVDTVIFGRYSEKESAVRYRVRRSP